MCEKKPLYRIIAVLSSLMRLQCMWWETYGSTSLRQLKPKTERSNTNSGSIIKMVEVNHHRSYDLLKNLAENEFHESGRSIDELKYCFAAEIDSVRQLARIKTYAELIDCLERRDALSEYKVDVLFDLADQLGVSSNGESELSEALLRYEAPKEVTSAEGPVNQYREQRLADQVRQQLNISGQHAVLSAGARQTSQVVPTPTPTSLTQPTPNAGVCTEHVRTAIYKVLANDLGNFWRRFGRELEIGEGAMDELELQFQRDLPSRVYKLLKLFEEDPCHDPKQNIILICNALDNCQRKDLRRKVEKIISH